MSFRGLEAVKVKVWNEKTGGGVQWYVVCVCGCSEEAGEAHAEKGHKKCWNESFNENVKCCIYICWH